MLIISIEKFEKDMAVFSFKQHQDVLTYLTQLKAKGWTTEDAKLWVEEKKKELVLQAKKVGAIATPIFSCSLCLTPMQLLPINFTPATLTGENSKSVWLCRNKVCMNTIYNKKTIAEIQAAKEGGN